MAEPFRAPQWLRPLPLLAGLILLFFSALWGCSEPEDPRPKGSFEDLFALPERSDLNVLFILVDTLRADRLGAYGYSRDTSPHLDALAKTGVRFAHSVSQSSWTKCSMASLWTGLYPMRSQVLRAQDAVNSQARMPAEIFRDAGFRTAGIWRNSWIAPNFGFSQGFEIYHSPRASTLSASARASEPGKIPGSDADIIRSASEFLRAHADERWFLYLHMMDVHQYVSDDESAIFGADYSDSYDNSIRWVDSLLGHLLDELDRRGLRDKTLIVFAADHGEAFGEHGDEGHARDVYAEVTETPLILSFPFRLEPGIVVENRSANVDIWPTVLDLLGLPGLENPDGKSRRPAIAAAARGEALPNDDAIFAQIDQTWGRLNRKPRPLVALNQGDWRLIYPAKNPTASALYDKAADPDEQIDLASRRPKVVEELVDIVTPYLSDSTPPWGDEATRVEIDEMQLQQLRAIGYGIQ